MVEDAVTVVVNSSIGVAVTDEAERVVVDIFMDCPVDLDGFVNVENVCAADLIEEIVTGSLVVFVVISSVVLTGAIVVVTEEKSHYQTYRSDNIMIQKYMYQVNMLMS